MTNPTPLKENVKYPEAFEIIDYLYGHIVDIKTETDEFNNHRIKAFYDGQHVIYTAYKGAALDNALNNGYTLCRCKDCAGCGLCWNNYVANIACEIH